jgi:cytochrome oxidase assembly protein ShyY1
MTPEKHFGYALQWFTMALAVTLAWLFFSFRKEEIE